MTRGCPSAKVSITDTRGFHPGVRSKELGRLPTAEATTSTAFQLCVLPGANVGPSTRSYSLSLLATGNALSPPNRNATPRSARGLGLVLSSGNGGLRPLLAHTGRGGPGLR